MKKLIIFLVCLLALSLIIAYFTTKSLVGLALLTASGLTLAGLFIYYYKKR